VKGQHAATRCGTDPNERTATRTDVEDVVSIGGEAGNVLEARFGDHFVGREGLGSLEGVLIVGPLGTVVRDVQKVPSGVGDVSNDLNSLPAERRRKERNRE
jgi:hypothetical protein